ncbi:MAG: hypothetical protein QOH17_3333 [Pseudonocardiales bacterium]|nr:hypothetical protein [Pseudonocardiales bacterium]
MNPLPFPVRIAAGLVATAVEQARDLPRLVVEFPVTAVSQALQASMRVQQRVTELAIKGDRVLGTLRPVEEKPSWATFDEDEPPARNGASTVTKLRPAASPASPASPASMPDQLADDVEPVPDPSVVEPVLIDADGPEPIVLPDFANLTIPQLRGRLRFLSLEDLRALLEWETTHGNRPPFVTMLTNRITTVLEE